MGFVLLVLRVALVTHLRDIRRAGGLTAPVSQGTGIPETVQAEANILLRWHGPSCNPRARLGFLLVGSQDLNLLGCCRN